MVSPDENQESVPEEVCIKEQNSTEECATYEEGPGQSLS